MKKLIALMIAITSFALVVPVLAQPGPGDSGVKEPGAGTRPGLGRRGMRSAAQGLMMLIRAYNPQTVTTVKGAVVSLETFPPKSRVAGVTRSAVLKTEQGQITVFLAPDSFLNEKKIALKAGDELEVTGSKVNFGQDRQPAVIVKDLKVGGKSLNLRNDRGYPVWIEAAPGSIPAE